MGSQVGGALWDQLTEEEVVEKKSNPLYEHWKT